MKIENSWLEDEVRSGFYVPSLMKLCWAASLETLSVFDAYCREHGLRYHIAFGTLLGAVRHQGFIPWDDDIDVLMPKEDYLKFMELAAKNPPEGYFVPNREQMMEMGQLTLRLYCAPDYETLRQDDFNPERHARKYRFPLPVQIDIFPWEPVLADADLEKARFDTGKAALTVLQALFAAFTEKVEPDPKALKALDDLEIALGHTPDHTLSPRKRVYDIIWMICDLADTFPPETWSDKRTDYVHHVQDLAKACEGYPWDDTTPVLFEGMRFPAPTDFDHPLRTEFGDYMTPVLGLSLHEYPYFRDHEKKCLEYYGRDWFFRYSFDREDLENPMRENRLKFLESWNKGLGLLETLHRQIEEDLRQGGGQTARLLERCQQGAQVLSSLLDLAGEEEDLLSLLEAYCEAAYQFYAALNPA